MHITKRRGIQFKRESLKGFFEAKNVLCPESRFKSSLAREWPAGMSTVKNGKNYLRWFLFDRYVLPDNLPFVIVNQLLTIVRHCYTIARKNFTIVRQTLQLSEKILDSHFLKLSGKKWVSMSVIENVSINGWLKYVITIKFLRS